MKVPITEYLRVDLNAERWECRRCDTTLGPARHNYKRGLLVCERDPGEVHRPLLDPERYAYTYAPDRAWCRLLEYCCPQCGVLVEVEYLPPGHPPVWDIELDIDALKRTWQEREALESAAVVEGTERAPGRPRQPVGRAT